MPDFNYDQWLADGTVEQTTDNTPYIKRAQSLDPFVWMGNCVRIDETAAPYGDITITRKRSPRGGVVPHTALQGIPDVVTVPVIMKKIQADRKRTDLKKCWWVFDDRLYCGGAGSSDPFGWSEIHRLWMGRFTNRADSATSYGEEAPAERMVTMAFGALQECDLYRIVRTIFSPGGSVQFTDVATFDTERCPDECDDREGCIVVAVTETDVANSYAVVNRQGGDVAAWETPITLTGFGINSATQVAGFREFGVIVSSADASLIYTRDLFANQTYIQTTDMAAHAPLCVDLIDESFIIAGGADGYIYISRDGAATWQTVSEGGTTTSDLTRVRISRSNPQVIYAISSAADVIIRSDNGGRTWYAQTATGTGGTGPTSIEINPIAHNIVRVGTDAGELFESDDGGNSWVEQTDLPDLTALTKANTTIADIYHAGCGVWGLVTENSADDERLFYRNVDNGADGRWFQTAEGEAVASGKSVTGLTACGPNEFVAVGGETVTDDLVMQVK